MPPLGPDPQADITTPEKEEILLSPMRIPIPKLKSPAMKWKQVNFEQFSQFVFRFLIFCQHFVLDRHATI